MLKKLLLLTASIAILTVGGASIAYFVFPNTTSTIALLVINRLLGSDASIEKLHPVMKLKVEAFIAEAHKEEIDLRITSTLRDMETQNILYSIGRIPGDKRGKVTNAKAGRSMHNYGFAVDVVEFINGKPDFNTKNWSKIGRLGKKHGLVWGGDWKNFKDRPHFQLRKRDINKIISKLR